jgi:hypothetical protein
MTRRRGIVAALAIAFLAAGSSAADPDGTLANCLARLDALVARTQADIDQVVADTAERLAQLDLIGTEQGMTRHARRARRLVGSEASAIFPDLNRLQGGCLRELLRAQAGPALTAEWRRACDDAVRDVRFAVAEARLAIDEALEAELAD